MAVESTSKSVNAPRPSRNAWGAALAVGALVVVAAAALGMMASPDEVGPKLTHIVTRGDLVVTVIEEGVILDNQIQVAHNVHIGAHTAIAVTSGAAGSGHRRTAMANSAPSEINRPMAGK